MKTNSKHVTRENKAEFGMNRNEFFEYKKGRCLELAKKGASVSEIAKDLGMSEKEMYAFLSRNFGGLKKMRASETPVKVSKSVSKSKRTSSANTFLGLFDSALEDEKDKILKSFRGEVEHEMGDIVNKVTSTLKQIRKDVIKNFKKGLVSDLKEIAVNL